VRRTRNSFTEKKLIQKCIPRLPLPASDGLKEARCRRGQGEGRGCHSEWLTRTRGYSQSAWIVCQGAGHGMATGSGQYSSIRQRSVLEYSDLSTTLYIYRARVVGLITLLTRYTSYSSIRVASSAMRARGAGGVCMVCARRRRCVHGVCMPGIATRAAGSRRERSSKAADRRGKQDIGTHTGTHRHTFETQTQGRGRQAANALCASHAALRV